MPGEFDPRLMNVLQGAMGLSDSLRDLGVAGEINIALNRSDGLLLLHLVTGASDAPAEEFSQRGRPLKAGMNSLRLAGVTFEWPQATVLNGALPGAPAAPANDNARDALLLSFGFEEETPALR